MKASFSVNAKNALDSLKEMRMVNAASADALIDPDMKNNPYEMNRKWTKGFDAS